MEAGLTGITRMHKLYTHGRAYGEIILILGAIAI
jgi:hypothetical protein